MKPSARQELHRRVFRLTIATISWNAVEAGVALTYGLLAGSVALTGFGIDSLIEVSSALFIFWKLLGRRTADAERREKTARKGIALTFLLLALWVLRESVSGLHAGSHPEHSTAGIILAALSLSIMPVLGSAKMRLGKTLKSRAIQADAVETLVCAWLSASLLAGLGLNAALDWWWADAAGALLMVPFLLWQAWETWEEAEDRD
jgi:divalent metal cation (Fe/Co/Zn/Cd) transporter